MIKEPKNRCFTLFLTIKNINLYQHLQGFHRQKAELHGVDDKILNNGFVKKTPWFL